MCGATALLTLRSGGHERWSPAVDPDAPRPNRDLARDSDALTVRDAVTILL